MDLGVLNRAELLATDLTDADLRRKVRSGELTRLRSGWYAGRDADDDAVIAARPVSYTHLTLPTSELV